jgi:osmotically-inducible protein OsmY
MPARETAADDLYLGKSLEEAIGDDERTAELGVRVEVRGGRAFLGGTVASASRKEAVAAVVAEHAPALEIVNEITVVDPADHGSAEPVEETLR